MTFAERMRQERRLMILRILREATGYEANQSILRAGLREIGLSTSTDALRADLAWLAEQDLVATREAGENFTVATLTERGGEVAEGAAQVPGVARPKPGQHGAD